MQVPATIMDRYRKVVLAGNTMFANKIPFFISISSAIKFGAVELLNNRKSETVLKEIKNIHTNYLHRGFCIEVLLLDDEFEPLQGDHSEMKITLNTVYQEEHVPEAERHIQILK